MCVFDCKAKGKFVALAILNHTLFKNHVTKSWFCTVTSCPQLLHFKSLTLRRDWLVTQKSFSQLDELMESNTK